MAMKAEDALNLAKAYTKKSLIGQGAIQGDKGDSAYQVAVNNGFVGTEEEWLESLKAGSVGISQEANNLIEEKEDGLYVPMSGAKVESISFRAYHELATKDPDTIYICPEGHIFYKGILVGRNSIDGIDESKIFDNVTYPCTIKELLTNYSYTGMNYCISVMNSNITDLPESGGTLTVRVSNSGGSVIAKFINYSGVEYDIVNENDAFVFKKVLLEDDIADFSNENLIMNPNFKIGAITEPIVDSTTSSIVATNWKIAQNGTYSVEFTENGMKITNVTPNTYLNLEYIVADYPLEDGVYALSLYCDKPENIQQFGCSSTYATIVSGNGYKFETNGNIVTNTYELSDIAGIRMFVQMLNSECDITIKWVKLEKGSMATAFIPPNNEVEKLKCGKLVDDTTASDTSTYSSSKIDSMIGDIETALDTIIGGA